MSNQNWTLINEENIEVSYIVEFFLDLVKNRKDVVLARLIRGKNTEDNLLQIKIKGTPQEPVFGFTIALNEDGSYKGGYLHVNDTPISGGSDITYPALAEFIRSCLGLVDMIDGDIIVRKVTTDYEDNFNYMINKSREFQAKKDQLNQDYYEGYNDCLNDFFDFKKK